MMARPVRVMAICGVVLFGASVPAHADLYRCEGADGRVTYTDNAAACPQARKHETTGAVQTVPSAPPPVARPASRAAQQGSLTREAEAAAEESWRSRKMQAQEQLEAVEQRRERLREAVGWCNRGGELWKKDEAGIKHGVSCDAVRREFEAIEPRIAELRAYLDGGLEEECRRAGCLPGWIR